MCKMVDNYKIKKFYVNLVFLNVTKEMREK